VPRPNLRGCCLAIAAADLTAAETPVSGLLDHHLCVLSATHFGRHLCGVCGSSFPSPEQAEVALSGGTDPS
jgi:hypothetical protein